MTGLQCQKQTNQPKYPSMASLKAADVQKVLVDPLNLDHYFRLDQAQPLPYPSHPTKLQLMLQSQHKT